MTKMYKICIHKNSNLISKSCLF